MTDNEIKLINMIRNHTHPNDAIVTAIDIICWYLGDFSSNTALTLSGRNLLIILN